MKAAALFLLTAIVTGAHAFWLTSEMMWGAPPNPLHFAALGGSILLFVAAMRAPTSPRAATKTGLAGCIAAWCLYAPLIVLDVFMPFTMGQEVRILASFRDYVPLVGLFGGPILLVASTAYTIFFLTRSQKT